MFNNTKYTKWYFNLIDSRKNIIRDINIFTEKHHIIPKSLGGSNIKDNIISLTPREHYICHLLLMKMPVDSKHRIKMAFAFFRMSQLNNKNNNRISSVLFERFRLLALKNVSNDNNYAKTDKFRKWLSENNPMHDPEVRKRHLDSVRSESYRKRQSENARGEKNPFYGKTHSAETKNKLSEYASKRTGKNAPNYGNKHKIVSCEFCKKQITFPMYRRWHGENCKINKKN